MNGNGGAPKPMGTRKVTAPQRPQGGAPEAPANPPERETTPLADENNIDQKDQPLFPDD